MQLLNPLRPAAVQRPKRDFRHRMHGEAYTNQPIADAGVPHPYGDTPSPKIFGNVSALAGGSGRDSGALLERRTERW
jgi:hypothetical protein